MTTKLVAVPRERLRKWAKALEERKLSDQEYWMDIRKYLDDEGEEGVHLARHDDMMELRSIAYEVYCARIDYKADRTPLDWADAAIREMRDRASFLASRIDALISIGTEE